MIKISSIDKPEPWLIPKVYAEAIEFLVTAWKMHPARAKLTPTHIPIKNLGTLMFQMIKASLEIDVNSAGAIESQEHKVFPKSFSWK